MTVEEWVKDYRQNLMLGVCLDKPLDAVINYGNMLHRKVEDYVFRIGVEEDLDIEQAVKKVQDELISYGLEKERAMTLFDFEGFGRKEQLREYEEKRKAKKAKLMAEAEAEKAELKKQAEEEKAELKRQAEKAEEEKAELAKKAEEEKIASARNFLALGLPPEQVAAIGLDIEIVRSL